MDYRKLKRAFLSLPENWNNKSRVLASNYLPYFFYPIFFSKDNNERKIFEALRNYAQNLEIVKA